MGAAVLDASGCGSFAFDLSTYTRVCDAVFG
jgi:hypothetical protein